MSLQSLPPELLDLVVSYLSDRPTLLALTLTCHSLRPAADNRLFREVVLRDGPAVTRFVAALKQRVERRRAIECVECAPDETGDMAQSVLKLLGTIKVRVLKVESPLITMDMENSRGIGRTMLKGMWWKKWVCNFIKKMERVGTAVKSPAFGRLTSFTLHCDRMGTPYYNYTTIHPIFLSPTLRYIHVICASFLGPPSKTDLRKFHTPLRTLILEQCHASPPVLSHLLSLPQSLTHLTLLLEPFPEITPAHAPQISDITALLTALSHQAPSLQYLRHRSFARPRPNLFLLPTQEMLSTLSTLLLDARSTGLRPFHHLQTLDLDICSGLLALLMCTSLSPLALQELGISGLDLRYRDDWKNLRAFLAPIVAGTGFRTLRMQLNPCRRGYADIRESLMGSGAGEIFEGVVQDMKREGRGEDVGVEVAAVGGWERGRLPFCGIGELGGRVVFDSRRGKEGADRNGGERGGEEEEEGDGEGVDERFAQREHVPLEVTLGFESHCTLGTK